MDHDRAVHDPGAVQERRADHDDRQQGRRALDDRVDRGQHAVEQRVLHQQVVDGVAAQRQLGEDRQRHRLVVALPGLLEHDLRVARGIGDRDRNRAGRDPSEAVGVRRPEVHAASLGPDPWKPPTARPRAARWLRASLAGRTVELALAIAPLGRSYGALHEAAAPHRRAGLRSQPAGLVPRATGQLAPQPLDGRRQVRPVAEVVVAPHVAVQLLERQGVAHGLEQTGRGGRAPAARASPTARPSWPAGRRSRPPTPRTTARSAGAGSSTAGFTEQGDGVGHLGGHQHRRLVVDERGEPDPLGVRGRDDDHDRRGGRGQANDHQHPPACRGGARRSARGGDILLFPSWPESAVGDRVRRGTVSTLYFPASAGQEAGDLSKPTVR